MSEPGSNNPPDMVEMSTATMHDLSAWMAENPVIQTMESAREAKLLLDRGKLCVADLTDEYKKKAAPFRREIEILGERYTPCGVAIKAVIEELSARLTDFTRAEERRRVEAANEARRLADEAERRARAAEAAEQEAIRSAGHGELGVDIASHVVSTEDAYRDAEVKARQAQLAERESKVRIGGGFKRATTLRNKETLILTNAIQAITSIGVTEEIREAILKSARTYRKLRGKLPDGVSVEITREV